MDLSYRWCSIYVCLNRNMCSIYVCLNRKKKNFMKTRNRNYIAGTYWLKTYLFFFLYFSEGRVYLQLLPLIYGTVCPVNFFASFSKGRYAFSRSSPWTHYSFSLMGVKTLEKFSFLRKPAPQTFQTDLPLGLLSSPWLAEDFHPLNDRNLWNLHLKINLKMIFLEGIHTIANKCLEAVMFMIPASS